MISVLLTFILFVRLGLVLGSHLRNVICRIRALGSNDVFLIDSAKCKFAYTLNARSKSERTVCIKTMASVECEIVYAL